MWVQPLLQFYTKPFLKLFRCFCHGLWRACRLDIIRMLIFVRFFCLFYLVFFSGLTTIRIYSFYALSTVFHGLLWNFACLFYIHICPEISAASDPGLHSLSWYGLWSIIIKNNSNCYRWIMPGKMQWKTVLASVCMLPTGRPRSDATVVVNDPSQSCPARHCWSECIECRPWLNIAFSGA